MSTGCSSMCLAMWLQVGQRRAAEDGTGVEVRGGQITSRVDVRLQPAAIISGRILDKDGEGLAGVEIEVLARRYLPTGVSPVAFGFAQTEASGAFRVGELQEGEYLVRAYVPAAVRPSNGDGTQAYAPTYFPQAAQSTRRSRFSLSPARKSST